LQGLQHQIGDLLLPGGLGQGGDGAVGGDLVVLHALLGADDHRVQDRALVVVLQLGLGLLDEAAHPFADLAPGPRAQLFQRLLQPLDLVLGLFGVHLERFFQRRRGGLLGHARHRPQPLLLGAVGVAQLFHHELGDVVHPASPPGISGARRRRARRTARAPGGLRCDPLAIR
jgi:hypothetical protein